jgi:outer membrane lipoprotein SlyB
MHTLTTSFDRSIARARGVAAALIAACIAGCATPAPRYVAAAGTDTIPLPPPTQVLFYPSAGQSTAQQDRDRYECYRWAVQQSAFDPGSPQVAPHQRVDVVSATPEGANTAGGAMTGAIVGAAVSRPRAAAGGALIGAIAGALIGATSDAENAAQTQREQERLDQRDARQDAQIDREASAFRRAMSACLEARHYTVR